MPAVPIARAARSSCPTQLTAESTRPVPVRTDAIDYSLRFHSVSPVSRPWDIITGPDGNLWVSGFNSRIGRLTTSGGLSTFDVRVSELVLSPGSDGQVWFGASNQIGSMSTTTGKVTGRFGFVGNPNDMTLGPDGNVWFANNPSEFGLPGTDSISRISPAGVITHFGPVSTAPFFVSPGPDGNVWFTEKNQGILGCVTVSGQITEYDPPGGGAPEGITLGPDGAIWITVRGTDRIARVSPSGSFRDFRLPEEYEEPLFIEAGPDGNLYFNLFGCFCEDFLANVVGRLTPEGVLTEFMLPEGVLPLGLGPGPDGKMWFTAPGHDAVFVLEDFRPCTITGTDQPDVLVGTPGSDIICGRAGDDVIDGGAGDDVIIGGVGRDAVDYTTSPTGVTVDLSSQTGIGSGSDELLGIENVIGSPHADEILGSTRSTALSGGDGADRISSVAFASHVIGGSGDDTLIGNGTVFAGGPGGDTMIGFASLMDGGDGDDLFQVGESCGPVGGCRDGGGEPGGPAKVVGGAGTDTLDATNNVIGLTIDLAQGKVEGCLSEPEPGFCELKIDFDIEGVEDVIGTPFDDTITGTPDVNRLSGENGNDVIRGDGNDDMLFGGPGDDQLFGEEGNDFLDGGADSDALTGGPGTDSCIAGEQVSECEP